MIDRDILKYHEIFELLRITFQHKFNFPQFADFSKFVIKLKKTKRLTHGSGGEVGIRWQERSQKLMECHSTARRLV